jgi:hypothetical protein
VTDAHSESSGDPGRRSTCRARCSTDPPSLDS